MKGVILAINRDARLIDISHEVPPHQVGEAAFVLKGAYPHFPPGTIHVAVVDPGVGGERRSILVDSGTHLFVGPDNGILTWVFRERPCRVFELTVEQYFLPEVSNTFHGRDVFAPVAGHLSLGTQRTEDFGRPIEDPVSLSFPEPVLDPGTITGEVIHIDRFGNLITNVPKIMMKGRVKPDEVIIEIGNTVIEGISKSYSQKESGELLSVIGGTGFLEVSVNMGNAQQTTGVRVGDKIIISLP